MSLLGKAIAIAATAFDGKIDKAGQPYILHCLRVMNAVKHFGEDYMIAAVLHDLLEDTKWTYNDLIKEMFNQDVMLALGYLTHDRAESYDLYIKRIGMVAITDPIARAVKLADLKDNSDITRLKGLTKKDFDRMEKYHRSYVYLSKI